jgi:hypothetical protein
MYNLVKVDIKTILSNNKYKTFNCSEEIKTSLIGSVARLSIEDSFTFYS